MNGFGIEQTASGPVRLMDLVYPYPPEFYRPEPPVTRIMGVDWGIPRIIRRCYSDVLPLMLDLRAAGVPLDFCQRVHDNLDRWDDDLVEAERIERSNLGEHGMAQVPDPGE